VVFFGYYLLSGLLEYIRVATASEWFSAIPGFLVLLVIFLVSAVPTYAVLFGRSKVLVDLSQGRVVEMFDIGFYRRAKIYALDQIKAVTIRKKVFRTKGHSSISNAVQILLLNDEVVTVGYEKALEDAKNLAEHVRNSVGNSQVQVIKL